VWFLGCLACPAESSLTFLRDSSVWTALNRWKQQFCDVALGLSYRILHLEKMEKWCKHNIHNGTETMQFWERQKWEMKNTCEKQGKQTRDQLDKHDSRKKTCENTAKKCRNSLLKVSSVFPCFPISLKFQLDGREWVILCWLNISFSLSILSINDLPEKIYNGARYPHVIPIPITLITTNYPNHSQPCCSCCGAKKSNEAYYQITREKDEPGQLWTYGSSPTRSLACTTDFSKLAQGGGNFSHRFLFGLGPLGLVCHCVHSGCPWRWGSWRSP